MKALLAVGPNSTMAAKSRGTRRAKYALVVVRHPDGSKSRLRVPTRSMNARVEAELATQNTVGRSKG